MNFEIDQDTYRDLEIFSSKSGASIFSILDKSRTRGAQLLLHRMMQEPTSLVKTLRARQECINFLYSLEISPDFAYQQFEFIDNYITLNKRCLGDSFIDALYDHLNYKINPGQDYYNILCGIRELLSLLSTIKQFPERLNGRAIPGLIEIRLDQIALSRSCSEKEP